MSDSHETDPAVEGPAAAPEFHRLREALTAFCDMRLVHQVISQERELTLHEHRQSRRPLLSEPRQLRPPSDSDWLLSGSVWPAFETAWENLISDFKGRIEREEVFLDGTQVLPVAFTERSAIPNGWAGMMSFDFVQNSIRTEGAKYTGIRVMRAAPRPVRTSDPMAKLPVHGFRTGDDGRIVFEPSQVMQLSHETISALLEEHARRVVEEFGVTLLPAGKISLIPLILRKMEHRAQNEGLLGLVSAEAKWLSAWVKEVAPTYHATTPNTVESAIRVRYAQLKPRSKGQI